jgi:hypothetical protein
MDDMDRIRFLNDQLRTTGLGGRTVITPMVQALELDDMLRLFSLVRTFNNFSDNDPNEKHDCGAVKLNDQSWYWKIDYDPDLKRGSEAPADPARPARVLTILNACEY